MLNLNAIQRFVDTVNKNHEEILEENKWREALGGDPQDNAKILNDLDPEDLLEAVSCLNLVIDPVTRHDVTELLGIKRKTGRKKSLIFDETPGCWNLLIVYAYTVKIIKYTEAVEALTTSFSGDQSSAKRFIKKHKYRKDLFKIGA
jgi:hypothetical protein